MPQAPAKKSVQQDKDYSMPKAHKGQIVLWYEGGVRNEDRSVPAVVKVANHSSLHLKVFGIDKDEDFTCVRHLNDPNAKEYDRINEGGWDFCFPDRSEVFHSPISNKENFAEVE